MYSLHTYKMEDKIAYEKIFCQKLFGLKKSADPKTESALNNI